VSALRFRGIVECVLCGSFFEFDVTAEGDSFRWFIEQLKAVGFAPLSFDHGDHVLIVYFDCDGHVMSSYVYPVVKGGVGVRGWTDIGGIAFLDSHVNMLFADWDEKVYCSAYWRGEIPPEEVLPLAESSRFITLAGRELWVLASQSNRMVVAREIGWNRGFFQVLQELLSQAARVEPKIVRSPTVQAILVSVASNPAACTPSASTLFMDLDKKVITTRAAKNLPFMERGFEPELVKFLENIGSYASLREAILSADPLQVALIARHYRTLKNTGFIKVTEDHTIESQQTLKKI